MITKDELRGLRDRGLTRQQIADKLDTSLSTVKRMLARHGLVNRRQARVGVVELNVVIDHSPEAGFNQMERARMRLGNRVKENARGYTLDGVPATAWDLLKAAGLSHTE